MNKIIQILVGTMCAISFAEAQNDWTKDDRNNLYNDCMGYSGKYKNITPEQKESICLCYLEEISKKHDRYDYQAKIEIEVKRIREATLSQCSKNIGVELAIQPAEEQKATVEPVRNKPSREALVGTWRTDKSSTIEFKEDGKFVETTKDGVVIPGEWFLDELGTLTRISEFKKTSFITKKEKTDRYTVTYDFNSFSKEFFKYTIRGTGETFQANRIK